MYNNDMRVANTATPSFTARANVGQFGWTDSDTSSFNQLIAYVDQCRGYAEDMQERLVYMDEKLKDLHLLELKMDQTIAAADTVKTYHLIVENDKNIVVGYKDQMEVLKADFDTKYGKFTTDTIIEPRELVLNNPWHSFGASYAPAGLKKLGKFVKFQGLVKCDDPNSVRAIGTIPPLYRPSNDHIFLCASAGGFVGIHISAALGEVAVRAQEGTSSESFRGWVSLDNISYFID